MDEALSVVITGDCTQATRLTTDPTTDRHNAQTCPATTRTRAAAGAKRHGARRQPHAARRPHRHKHKTDAKLVARQYSAGTGTARGISGTGQPLHARRRENPAAGCPTERQRPRGGKLHAGHAGNPQPPRNRRGHRAGYKARTPLRARPNRAEIGARRRTHGAMPKGTQESAHEQGPTLHRPTRANGRHRRRRRRPLCPSQSSLAPPW